MRFLQNKREREREMELRHRSHRVCTIDSHNIMQIPGRTKNQNWSKRVTWVYCPDSRRLVSVGVRYKPKFGSKTSHVKIPTFYPRKYYSVFRT